MPRNPKRQRLLFKVLTTLVLRRHHGFPGQRPRPRRVLSETVRKTKVQILRELVAMDEIDYQPERSMSATAQASLATAS